jgi:hypothetical protein
VSAFDLAFAIVDLPTAEQADAIFALPPGMQAAVAVHLAWLENDDGAQALKEELSRRAEAGPAGS